MSTVEFREEVRDWLEANCPPSMRQGTVHFEDANEVYSTEDAGLWQDRAATRGWTAPTWPTQYGGGGMGKDEAMIFGEELARIKALPPSSGMGLAMIGPTLLEYGTEEQKQRHIPKIVTGESRWCQGYSEPGAGSDLAGLQTKAVLDGDNFVINGQKIWTSGAQFANWMFALVRTNPDVPKHEGISFVLLTMEQPGVTVKPIKLISGSSPFCETFFDDAIAKREDLIGELNKGWTVGKRLLQYERNPTAHGPAYHYIFDWVSPAQDGTNGAPHGIDIGFVFGTHDVDKPSAAMFGSGPAADALAAATMDAWAAFAHSGDPATAALGAWPVYGDQRETMMIGGAAGIRNAPFEAERAAWDGIATEHLR